MDDKTLAALTLTLVIGGIVFFTIVLPICVRIMRTHLRNKRMAQYAAAKGYQFQAKPTQLLFFKSLGWLTMYSRWARVRQGVFGQFQGVDFLAFGHEGLTNNRKDPDLGDIGVVALRLPVALPNLDLDPPVLRSVTKFADRVVRFFGGTPAPPPLEWDAFSDKYQIRAQDMDYARALLNPDLMEWLMLPNVGPVFCIRDDYLIRITGKMSPETVESTVPVLYEFYRRIRPEMFGTLR
ncbi:MAG: hypothetical protein LBR58_03500 [Propionibacteriaceae bacterium]|jgi:hypothetical protein|nr:hypothetical protein [Propionibacteriaceae bacterium]